MLAAPSGSLHASDAVETLPGLGQLHHNSVDFDYLDAAAAVCSVNSQQIGEQEST